MTGRRLAGVAFLLVISLLVWLSVALYHKQFTRVDMVTLYTGGAGNEMTVGAPVMARGVQVGEVRGITANGSGARLELALTPSAAGQLPANVTAEMAPTTLFGERYVDLILPAAPAAARLASGGVITQDRSADAVELESVLNNLLPLLKSVQPDQLAVTLTAIAQGLSGRGAELGQTLVTLHSYLRQLDPRLPALDTDIKRLAVLSRDYSQAAPRVLQALADLTVTSQTVAANRASLTALISNVTSASGDLRQFLTANSGDVIQLSADSTATLATLARYAPEYPCLLGALAKFVPVMNKALGAGTKQPGLHIQARVIPEYVGARYRPGADTPVYGDNLGPRCYRTPLRGVTLHDSAGTAGGHAAAGHAAAASPELTRELTALAAGVSPDQVPSWGGLLTGPVFTGGRVTVAVSPR